MQLRAHLIVVLHVVIVPVFAVGYAHSSGRGGLGLHARAQLENRLGHERGAVFVVARRWHRHVKAADEVLAARGRANPIRSKEKK